MIRLHAMGEDLYWQSRSHSGDGPIDGFTEAHVQLAERAEEER